MNFSTLPQAINKNPRCWLPADVALWLQHISLPLLVEPFLKANINGLKLLSLSQKHLQIIGVLSKIARKKILRWIGDGLSQFQNYVQQDLRNRHKHASRQLPLLRKNSQVSLILTPLQKNRSFYCIDQNGGTIGKHPNSTVTIFDNEVSRNHARIAWNKQLSRFQVEDKGSRSGTFIKMQRRMQLKEKLILQFGSHFFKVQQLKLEEHSSQIVFSVRFLHQPVKLITVSLFQDKPFVFGRALELLASFAKDSFMSAQHCRIQQVGNTVWAQDASSANGTWMRLSDSGVASEPVSIDSGQQLKFANNQFECRVQISASQEQEVQQQSLLCQRCMNKPQNALLQPCNHSLSCVQCAGDMQRCQICGKSVGSVISMYVL